VCFDNADRAKVVCLTVSMLLIDTLLSRVAPSFVRLGTFQLPASRGGGEEVLTKQVADYGEWWSVGPVPISSMRCCLALCVVQVTVIMEKCTGFIQACLSSEPSW
jgi:hypothetical protein